MLLRPDDRNVSNPAKNIDVNSIPGILGWGRDDSGSIWLPGQTLAPSGTAAKSSKHAGPAVLLVSGDF